MKEFNKLKEIVGVLRGENGCPWDQKQTFYSMKKYVLEEVYELLEAIEEENPKEIKEELGDILMHVVFLSQLAKEKGWFQIQDVLNNINQKLQVRHPHIFGQETVSDVEEVLKNWEALKKQEKKDRVYTLDGIPKTLSAINQSIKIQEKLSRVGFDWLNQEGVLDKIQEEIKELKQEVLDKNLKKMELEFGDVLFVLINFALKNNIDPEAALKKVNHKVIQRFSKVEDFIKEDKKNLETLSLQELEKYWQGAKKLEKIEALF